MQGGGKIEFLIFYFLMTRSSHSREGESNFHPENMSFMLFPLNYPGLMFVVRSYNMF